MRTSVKHRLAGIAASTVLGTVPLLAPVPVAQAAGPLHCRAHVGDPTPADYTYVRVFVTSAAYARIRTVAHYKTTDTTKFGRTNGHGRGSTQYYISDATPGFRVYVDVFVHKRRRSGHCLTSFVPHR